VFTKQLLVSLRKSATAGFFSRYSITPASLPVSCLHFSNLPGLGNALQSKTNSPPLPLKSIGDFSYMKMNEL